MRWLTGHTEVGEEDAEEEEREFVDTEERVQEVLSQVLSRERGV